MRIKGGGGELIKGGGRLFVPIKGGGGGGRGRQKVFCIGGGGVKL